MYISFVQFDPGCFSLVAGLAYIYAPISLVPLLGWAEEIVGKLSYPERMKRAYGLDPLRCAQCGGEIWLWYVWHPDYGVIYDELAQLRAGKYDLPSEVKPPADKDTSEPVMQWPLFEWPTSFVYA